MTPQAERAEQARREARLRQATWRARFKTALAQRGVPDAEHGRWIDTVERGASILRETPLADEYEEGARAELPDDNHMGMAFHETPRAMRHNGLWWFLGALAFISAAGWIGWLTRGTGGH